ncbi:hypothetical protein AB4059_07010 [Lysobacter sp. 2RAF19]
MAQVRLASAIALALGLATALPASAQDSALDAVRRLAWRGDYAGAIEALDASGVDDAEARALRARIQAWAGRRNDALALNRPLYEQARASTAPVQVAALGNVPVETAAPTDAYGIAWTQALAERIGERPERALDALATVQALQPDSKDTLALAKAVRLPLYSYVGAPLSVYSDSDDIEIRTATMESNLRVSDAVRLSFDATNRTHESPVGSPFASLRGGDSIDERRLFAGVRLSPSSDFALDLRGGRSELDFADGTSDGATIGRIAFTHRASDAFTYGVAAERDRVAYSPRALSNGVMRNGVVVDLTSTPTMRDTITARLAADAFSDGNNHRGIDADWRHAVYRSEAAWIDVGLQAQWLGYSTNPGTGYYSPEDYRRFAPVVSGYFAFGEEVALQVSAAVGVQRDESFDGWKRATDANATLSLGLFGHWQLLATAAYSERLNEFGQYTGHSMGLQMRYRFCEFRADRCP